MMNIQALNIKVTEISLIKKYSTESKLGAILTLFALNIRVLC